MAKTGATAPLAYGIEETDRLWLRVWKTRKQQIKIGLVWVGMLSGLFWVLVQLGLDVEFMKARFALVTIGKDAFRLAEFPLWQGIVVTIKISIISIMIAIVLALLGALARLSNNALFNGIASFYVSFIRGTPLLVQIYIVFLGLPRFVPQDVTTNILTPVNSAIIALSVNYGAYMTEIFRAGIQSIGHGQTEAAYALGMTYWQTMRRIVLPQAFRVIIPPVGNEFIAMLKDSSLVSVAGGVWDLTFLAQKVGRRYFRNMETFIIAAGLYWLLTIVFSTVQSRIEGRFSQAYER